MKIEQELIAYLHKKYGTWENLTVEMDTGKTIRLVLDFGDDEELTITINRRNGYHGNYRIIATA